MASILSTLTERRMIRGLPAGRRLVSAMLLIVALAMGSGPAAAQGGAIPPASDQGAGVRTVELTTTKAMNIDLPRDARDVLIADPLVADIVIKSPRRAYVIGLKAGDTNAFFLDEEGNRILHTVSKVLFRKHLELSPYFRSDGVLLEFKPATA